MPDKILRLVTKDGLLVAKRSGILLFLVDVSTIWEKPPRLNASISKLQISKGYALSTTELVLHSMLGKLKSPVIHILLAFLYAMYKSSINLHSAYIRTISLLGDLYTVNIIRVSPLFDCTLQATD